MNNTSEMNDQNQTSQTNDQAQAQAPEQVAATTGVATEQDQTQGSEDLLSQALAEEGIRPMVLDEAYGDSDQEDDQPADLDNEQGPEGLDADQELDTDQEVDEPTKDVGGIFGLNIQPDEGDVHKEDTETDVETNTTDAETYAVSEQTGRSSEEEGRVQAPAITHGTFMDDIFGKATEGFRLLQEGCTAILAGKEKVNEGVMSLDDWIRESLTSLGLVVGPFSDADGIPYEKEASTHNRIMCMSGVNRHLTLEVINQIPELAVSELISICQEVLDYDPDSMEEEGESEVDPDTDDEEDTETDVETNTTDESDEEEDSDDDTEEEESLDDKANEMEKQAATAIKDRLIALHSKKSGFEKRGIRVGIKDVTTYAARNMGFEAIDDDTQDIVLELVESLFDDIDGLYFNVTDQNIVIISDEELDSIYNSATQVSL
jgi:hypothetical protein